MNRLPACLTALAVLLGAFVGPIAPARAQDSRAHASAPHFRPEQAARFSKQVEDDLAARGARVAMVFRLGRPREDLPEGISYTHGAFWVYRTLTTADGETTSGYAVYNLYAGDGQAWPVNRSRLAQDWPLDFVRGSTVDDVAVIVPTPEMQRRILTIIDSPTYEQLHNPAYTLVSNPWERKYQNCNTFMLDVLGAAIWETSDPDRITKDLKSYFRPTIVHASGLTRLFGPMTDARLRTDDQHGPIRTATYESLVEFMRRFDLLNGAYTLAFNHAT
ncbi:MAG: DUF2145 domain-containing protein [Alphaproteobacteria bacterium]